MTPSNGSGGIVAETAVLVPLDNSQVISSPDAYLINIPPNARPGKKFPVTIEGRTLMVTCPPNGQPGMRVRVAANVKMTVTLPTGKLGVFFKGKKKAKVSRLEPFSPLKEILREEMTVDSLDIPGNGRYTGLSAVRLGEILAESIDVENRKLVVIKRVMHEPKKPRNVNEPSTSHVAAHGLVAGLEAWSFFG